MSPIPPPPPPPNVTNISSKNSKPAGIPNTSALLKSIEKGTKLKKTATNDRSAPLVLNQPNSTAPNGSNQNFTSSSSSNSGNPALRGLFANGFPTLRSAKNSANANQNNSKSAQNFAPAILKQPISSAAENITEAITRNPEKVYDISKKGIEIVEPVVAGLKKQGTRSLISNNIPSNIKSVGEKISKISISIPPKSINSEHESEAVRWNFGTENEKNFPAPRKFTGCKKVYLSEINSENARKSQSGTQISEEDIGTFIKTLKSKLNKAASEENFEECVRLKKKLHSFETFEKRIKSGEKILSSELSK